MAIFILEQPEGFAFLTKKLSLVDDVIIIEIA